MEKIEAVFHQLSWGMNSMGVALLVAALTFLVVWYKKKVLSDDKGIHAEIGWFLFLLIFGGVFALGFFLILLGTYDTGTKEYFQNGIGPVSDVVNSLLGVPTALAGSLVAIILAQRALKLTKDQVNLEKINSLKELVGGVNDVNEKLHRKYFYLYRSLQHFLTLSRVAYDEVLDFGGVMHTYNAHSDEISAARKDVIDALEGVAEDHDAMILWEICSRKKLDDDEYDVLSNIDGVFADYERRLSYELPDEFTPLLLAQYLKRFHYRDGGDALSDKISRMEEQSILEFVRGGSFMMRERIKHLRLIPDESHKLNILMGYTDMDVVMELADLHQYSDKKNFDEIRSCYLDIWTYWDPSWTEYQNGIKNRLKQFNQLTGGNVEWGEWKQSLWSTMEEKKREDRNDYAKFVFAGSVLAGVESGFSYLYLNYGVAVLARLLRMIPDDNDVYEALIKKYENTVSKFGFDGSVVQKDIRHSCFSLSGYVDKRMLDVIDESYRYPLYGIVTSGGGWGKDMDKTIYDRTSLFVVINEFEDAVYSLSEFYDKLVACREGEC